MRVVLFFAFYISLNNLNDASAAAFYIPPGDSFLSKADWAVSLVSPSYCLLFFPLFLVFSFSRTHKKEERSHPLFHHERFS